MSKTKRRSETWAALLTVLVGMAGAGEASAQERMEPEEHPISERFRTNLHKQHDRGLMTRLSGGVSYLEVWDSTPELDGVMTANGASFTYSVAVGWLPAERFALHLSQWGTLSKSLAHLAIGPGATYWFSSDGPWFVSSSAGVVALGKSELFDAIALGGEVEFGLYGWISDFTTMGVSLFAAAEGLDIDGDGQIRSSWRLGLRIGVEIE